VAPDRRFHTFNDYLRARFGDRVQRVTLTGGLVCPNPDGREACVFCSESVRKDAGYGHGFPVHEQVRRSVNFSRRQGHAAPRLLVAIPLADCPPADHLRATLASVFAQEEVVVITVTTRSECATPEMPVVIGEFASPDRDLWIELSEVPAEPPFSRGDGIKLGVSVHFNGVGIDEIAAGVSRVMPDAVGFVAPLILDKTPEAERYLRGALEEPDLHSFAENVAEVLQRIPAGVAIHPIVVPERADHILAPRWALNRQKVQEAVGRALETAGESQGSRSAG